MLNISFQPDAVEEGTEASIREWGPAALEKHGHIRIRIQPNIYDVKKATYQTWRLLSWTIEAPTIEEALAFKDAMEAFMATLKVYDPATMAEWLKQVVAQAAEERAKGGAG